MSRLQKIRDINVYAAPDWWAGNPNVILLRTGEILIGFRRAAFPVRGDSDPTLRPFSMKVGGLHEIGSAEMVPILDEPNSLTPAFFQRRDGRILCFFNRYATHPRSARRALAAAGRRVFTERDDRLFTREPITLMTSGNGVSWKRFSEIDIPGWAYPPAFRGNMIEACDGSILFSVYTSPGSAASQAMQALLIRSPDGGRTWQYVSTIADHPDPEIGFGETSLFRTGGGRLIAFLRANGSAHTVHTAASDDDGQTWAPFVCHKTYGYPQDALRLESGNVLLTYGVRKPPHGVRAKLLNPSCDNTDEAEEFYVRDDSANGGCGYPMSIQVADGTIFTIYYLTPEIGKPARIAGTVMREV